MVVICKMSEDIGVDNGIDLDTNNGVILDMKKGFRILYITKYVRNFLNDEDGHADDTVTKLITRTFVLATIRERVKVKTNSAHMTSIFNIVAANNFSLYNFKDFTPDTILLNSVIQRGATAP